MKNLVIIILALFISSFTYGQYTVPQETPTQEYKLPSKTTNKTNRGIDDPNRWIAQKSFFCKTEGYTISILRKASYSPGQSAYKIEVQFHRTLTEYCGQTRRNILANAYSSNLDFSSLRIATNAAVGDYCGNDRNWVTGTVYEVTYPIRSAGTVQTTGILHNTTIQADVTHINDLVSRFRNYHTSTVPNCYDQKCKLDNKHKVKDGALKEMEKLRKKQKELMKDHTKHLDSVSKDSKSNGGIPHPNYDPASKQMQKKEIDH